MGHFLVGPPRRSQTQTIQGEECRAGTGATVAQVPEPRPRSVRQVPEPRCPLSTGTAHDPGQDELVESANENAAEWFIKLWPSFTTGRAGERRRVENPPVWTRNDGSVVSVSSADPRVVAGATTGGRVPRRTSCDRACYGHSSRQYEGSDHPSHSQRFLPQSEWLYKATSCCRSWSLG